jgi:hypothetical protein
MIFSENRYPLFGIMLWTGAPGGTMRARLRATVVLALLAAPASALAQAAQPPASPTCAVAGDDSWTAQEKFVWTRTCNGEAADFNAEPGYGGTLDPLTKELPANRVLTTTFIEKILTDDTYSGAIKRHGVRVTGARFTETLDLQNIELGSELWFEQCLFEKGADLSWLRSTQPIAFNNSKVAGPLNFYAAQIGSDLHVTGSVIAEVNLNGAHVSRTLDLSNSRVTDTLDIPNLQVGTDLRMREAEFSGEINLRYSQIGGELDWRGASFAQDVDLTRAHVDGAFLLGSANHSGSTQPDSDQPGPARWAKDVALTARFAKLAIIPRLSDAWPNNLHIVGLTYDGIESVEGFESGDGFQQWLDRQRRYSRQPYEQLANILQAQGEIENATAVRYAERERDRGRSGQRWYIFAWLTLLKYLIGYGYYPYRSIVWVFLLVIVGAVVLRVSGQGPKNDMPIGLSYSFDMLLPVIRLREQHYNVDLTGAPRYYFYCHKIMGWVLASFLVAGLSGLTK